MIDQETVKEIERLLAEDRLSQRRIAQELGVSRGTVARISRGDRPDYEELRRRREEREVPAPDGPAQRCAGCGALVQMPCVACRVRKEMGAVATQLRAFGRVLDEPLGVQLEPRHRRRYETIRARKEREEARRARHDAQREARREAAARRTLARMRPADALAALGFGPSRS